MERESLAPDGGVSPIARPWSVDLCFTGFVLATAAVTLVFAGRVPHAVPVALAHLAALAVFLGVKRAARAHRAWRAVYLILPFGFTLALFTGMGFIIPHLRAWRGDAALAALDHAIFRSEPTRWLDLTPLTAGLLQICYLAYYFVPVVLAVDLAVRRSFWTLLHYSGVIVGCFFLTYVGYYLVPAVGPRSFYVYDAPLPLTGVPLWINHTIDYLENIKLDAFPSGHTAIAALCLALLFRQSRMLGWLMTPLVAGLVVSTVALRYHYAVDVIAGLLCTMLWLRYAAPLMERHDLGIVPTPAA